MSALGWFIFRNSSDCEILTFHTSHFWHCKIKKKITLKKIWKTFIIIKKYKKIKDYMCSLCYKSGTLAKLQTTNTLMNGISNHPTNVRLTYRQIWKKHLIVKTYPPSKLSHIPFHDRHSPQTVWNPVCLPSSPCDIRWTQNSMRNSCSAFGPQAK